MKIETTIALEPDLLQKLTRLLEANGHSSLSELIEDLVCGFLAKAEKPAYDLGELELINKNAERLNKEAEDVLTYQIDHSQKQVDSLYRFSFKCEDRFA